MKVLVNLLIFLIIFVIGSDSGVPLRLPDESKTPNVEKEPEIQGLYDSNDKVITLTSSNMKVNVLNQEHATLLEFYNSFCGHCRRFAPKYKKLAKDLYRWIDVLKVAAIDCATDENNDICREYEVMGYPSLRYFGPKYEDGERRLGVSVDTQDIDALKKLMVTQLMNETGKAWPDFTSLTDSNVHNLFNGLADIVQYALVIYETENSTVAPEVILNFLKIKELKVYRVTSSKIANDLGIETYNVIKFFKRNSDTVSIPLPNITPESITIVVDNFLLEKGIVDKSSDNKKPNSGSPVGDLKQNDNTFLEEVKKNRQTIYQADLEHALRFTIFHEIPAFREITGERLLALQKYINILSKYNPLGENGRKFIEDLKKFAFMHSQELKGEAFQQKVMELHQVYTPIFSSSRYIGCQPSKAGYRGFSCGLWTLFHFMTVQAAEDENSTDPLEVLHAMHGYVKFFFGCTHCANHFQEMAARRKIWNTTSKDDAVLWLWSAHNEVNKRLSGDETEDPEFPKVQYPTKDLCPECQRDTKISIPDEEINWDKTEVLLFLKRIHSPQNISRLGVDDETVLPASLDKLRAKRMISSVFSDIDMRMGILLYLFCVGMMFLAVKLFLRKSYRKKPYTHAMLGKV